MFSHVYVWGEGWSIQRNSQCKGPEAEHSSRIQEKARMFVAEWVEEWLMRSETKAGNMGQGHIM